MFGSGFIEVLTNPPTMTVLTDTIEVQNVGASSSIGREVDLASLSDELLKAEYEPDKFPAVVYRMQRSPAVVLIFRTGKMICTGVRSVEAVSTAVHDLFVRFRSMGIDTPDSPVIEVQNIVSSADLGTSVNLNAAAIGLGLEVVEFEPEQFPGLVYRLDDPDVVALLFASGKLVITGATETRAAEQALETIDSELSELGLR